MTKDEALRLALEALEEACEIVGAAWTWRDEKGRPAITAIKEALTQREQDGECKRCTDGCPACDARKLPEREIATAVLEHCYSPMAVTSDMIDRTTEVIKAKLKEKNT